MLDRPAWLAQPSAGFLHAFDLAVHLGGAEDFRIIASVMRLEDAGGQAVKNGTDHAAFLALDRLATRATAQTVAQLAADQALLAWSPHHRGALLARADLTCAQQITQVEQCLEGLADRPEELDTFTELFPNRNGVRTHSLVSEPEDLPDHTALHTQDEAALAQVDAWLAQDRFPRIRTQLESISHRLHRLLKE
jgi:hypothetical protein